MLKHTSKFAALLSIAIGLLASAKTRPLHAQAISPDIVLPEISLSANELVSNLPPVKSAELPRGIGDAAPDYYVAQNETSAVPGGRAAMNQARQGANDSDGGSDGSSGRLIDRVVDPIAWLMQFRFRQDWNWPVDNTGVDNQHIQFRPTIPFKAWDQVNLFRVSVPYNTQGPGPSEIGKVEMFDAVVFEPQWGRWGFGPDVRFEPSDNSGAGNTQGGPVFGAVAKSERWTYGFISQNYLGGDDSETYIQPILAYKFNDQVALAWGDMQFKYSWTKRTWTQLPLGIELDYIAGLWGQKIQFFANPQYNFEQDSSNSGWTIFVGLTLLVPGA